MVNNTLYRSLLVSHFKAGFTMSVWKMIGRKKKERVLGGIPLL